MGKIRVSTLILFIIFAVPLHSQTLLVSDDEWDSTDIFFPESLESIIFPPNPRWENIADLPQTSFFRQSSQPVGRLKVRRPDGVALCTAFLVSRREILTNNHCIPGPGGVFDAIFELGYHTQGGQIDRYSVNIEPITTSRQLDISLLELEEEVDSRWGNIQFDADSIPSGVDLFIIHHPGGQTMKLSRIGCFAGPPGQLPEGHFLHQCDTIGGSSGSPIFNMDGLVVGIHHRGTPDRGANAYNRGTQISYATEIISFLDGFAPVPAISSDVNSPPAIQNGIISFPDGSEYEGQYITDGRGNRLPHGDGAIRYSNDLSRVGQFVNGVPNGVICVYDGEGNFYQMETFFNGSITGAHIRLVDSRLNTYRHSNYVNGDITGNFTVVWADGQWEQFYTELGASGQQSTQRVDAGNRNPPGIHDNMCI